MLNQLTPLDPATPVPASHWSLPEPASRTRALASQWTQTLESNPGHTIIAEIDYHFGERKYSLGVFLSPVKVEWEHDAYPKEGRFRVTAASIEEVFDLAYWYADDWMIDSFVDDGNRDSFKAPAECYPFRFLIHPTLRSRSRKKNMGPLTCGWLDSIRAMKTAVGSGSKSTI